MWCVRKNVVGTVSAALMSGEVGRRWMRTMGDRGSGAGPLSSRTFAAFWGDMEGTDERTAFADGKQLQTASLYLCHKHCSLLLQSFITHGVECWGKFPAAEDLVGFMA